MKPARKLTQALVLAAINAAPEGVTSRQLAEQFDAPLVNVSRMAGVLRDYGEIDAVIINNRSRALLWKSREART